MTAKKEIRYDKDFYAWAIYNAKLLREGKLSAIDIENVAEELESMGKSEKRELINRLAVLMAHLLKWQFQPTRRNKSWKYTIEEQRDEVMDLVADSPSLKKELASQLARAYKKAILHAASETSIDKKTFPTNCPYTLKQVLNKTFFPDS